MKIQKDDNVKILIGKDKGREGKVLQAIPKKNLVVVQGLNTFKKHVKPSQNQKGGIVTKERALAVSKVILICPNCKKAFKVDEAGFAGIVNQVRDQEFKV